MKKSHKIIFWIATIWLALGMLATGITQLLKLRSEGSVAPPGLDGIIQMGYPVYLLTIIGVWKILGVVALLIPRYPLLKEWTYAGFFFLMTGAVYSHIALRHSFGDIFPSVLLMALIIVSWYFRPASRKVVLANQ